MKWICAKCGRVSKNIKGKHYWIPAELKKVSK
jgi:hypothetical protein